MDDILQQARRGSVSAIIQVLNDKLADSGIRTRAVFEDGVLQLLCEAATVEQLEESVVVDRIRHLLEYIAPRNIRRVKINSRIVREQQLLWLDEIQRDPNNQLLWWEEIKLRRPSLLKRLLSSPPPEQSKGTKKTALPSKPVGQLSREQKLYRRGMMGGVMLGILLVAGATVAGYYWWTSQGSSSAPTPTQAQTPTVTPSSQVTVDPFAEAVRLAESAVREGQQATSAAQWLAIATQWQKASDLMATIPSSDPRFQTAQDRTQVYRKNSQAALKAAQTQK